MAFPKTPTWWGPPKKFDTHFEERRISWLELFYDLVYVIAISRITHHLAIHMSLEGFLEYACLFILIFWGWLNGSLYYDIHGTAGLRTRLMTLWQVMIIAGVAATIDQASPQWHINTTILFMIMQLYITYLWWSVGFYDKAHRQYNRPYTILFLVAFVLMALSLFVSRPWVNILAILVIICNYSPPFIAQRLLRRSSLDLNLSSSMSERLGLLTTIVFGEVVLGVVNGIAVVNKLDFFAWLNFALSLAIVFALWWIVFALASNRNAKPGFVNATLLELLCIPTLMALGVIAVYFSRLFVAGEPSPALNLTFGCAIAIFLTGLSLLMGLLVYPDVFRSIRKPVRGSLVVTALLLVVWNIASPRLEIQYYLLVVVAILVAEIIWLNSLYYNLNVDEEKKMKNSTVESP